MKNKYALPTVMLCVFFLFAACGAAEKTLENEDVLESSYLKGSPEYTADCFLIEFKKNNIAAMRDYIADGNFSLDENSTAQNKAVEYTWKVITENFEYEILSSEEKYDAAHVNVKMKNISVSGIMMDTYEEFNKTEISRTPNAEEDDVVAEFYPILKKYAEEYKKKEKYERTVTIDLIKDGDEWKIVNDNNVYDAMTGDYISFILRILVNYVDIN